MASTLTTLLKLFKATPGTNEQFRTTDVNGNWDKIDQNIGAFTCTSTTRPVTPFVTQRIWETDTLMLRMWTGTEWAWIGGKKPKCTVRRSNNQNTPNLVWTCVGFDELVAGETVDVSNEFFSFATGGADGRIRVKKAGSYTIETQVTCAFPPSTAVGRGNSGAFPVADSNPKWALDKGDEVNGVGSVSVQKRLAANDYVAVWTFNHGAAAAVVNADTSDANGYPTRLTVTYDGM